MAEAVFGFVFIVMLIFLVMAIVALVQCCMGKNTTWFRGGSDI